MKISLSSCVAVSYAFVFIPCYLLFLIYLQYFIEYTVYIIYIYKSKQNEN